MAHTILVLQSSESDKFLLDLLLRRGALDAEIVGTKSTEETETFLDSLDEDHQIDCAILDYTVAGGAAFKLLGHPKMKSVPAILLTSVADAGVGVRAIQSGFQDHLVRGEIDMNALIRTVRYAMERNRIRLKLLHLVHIDTLTGVLNRRGLNDVMRHLDYLNSTHVVILLDVDNFKKVNDMYGYSVGDEVLQLIAQGLQKLARTGDEVARIGGDEFMLLLRDQPLKTGMLVAERVRSWLETATVNVDGHEFSATASIGVAQVTPGADVAELLNLTQDALHKSKRSGKNTISQSPSPGPHDEKDSEETSS